MATIANTLALQDKFTNTINKATQGVNRLLKAMEQVDVNTLDVDMKKTFREGQKAIQATEKELQELVKGLDTAKNKADPFSSAMGFLKKAIAGAGALRAVKGTMALADSFTTTRARLDLMNDGLQTTEALQNKIMASASRSRAAYLETADAVSKMGVMAKDAFGSNEELIAFTELINKQFTIAGASREGQSAAMLQLTQAMASGVLRGEELNSIFEQAPTIIQTIADYLQVPVGQIRELAQEGQLTANIVKNAMFHSADSINQRFEAMPMTFSQVATVVQNMLLQAFGPAIQYIGRGAQWIYDNWNTVAPVLAGVAGAVLFLGAAWGIHTAATWLSVAANRALITTMLASPITWVAVGLGVLIGVLYQWVQSVGGAEIAWAMFCDQVLALWAGVKYGFSAGAAWVCNMLEKIVFFGKDASVDFQNFMGDMKAGALARLQEMANGCIEMVNNFIQNLNKIPGISIELFDNATFGTVAQLENNVAKQQRNAERETARNKMNDNIARRQKGLENQLSQAQAASAARKADIAAKQAAAEKKVDSLYGGAGQLPEIGKVNEVGKIAADVNIADEDLKLMKDVAEMRYVQNFVTLQPSVSMSASVTKDADFDAFYNRFSERITQELEASAEGVY